jgi:hypothetical protein
MVTSEKTVSSTLYGSVRPDLDFPARASSACWRATARSMVVFDSARE